MLHVYVSFPKRNWLRGSKVRPRSQITTVLSGVAISPETAKVGVAFFFWWGIGSWMFTSSSADWHKKLSTLKLRGRWFGGRMCKPYVAFLPLTGQKWLSMVSPSWIKQKKYWFVQGGRKWVIPIMQDEINDPSFYSVSPEWEERLLLATKKEKFVRCCGIQNPGKEL